MGDGCMGERCRPRCGLMLDILLWLGSSIGPAANPWNGLAAATPDGPTAAGLFFVFVSFGSFCWLRVASRVVAWRPGS